MRYLDLLAILVACLCAWLLGNNVATLGVWSAGNENLSLSSALFFLSHNNAEHAAENIQSGVSYAFLIFFMRRFLGQTGDRPYVVAALIVSHFATLATFIWILPFSEIGSHGLSVATSALLALVLTFSIAIIAQRTRPMEIFAITAVWACAFAAGFFAISARRHGFETDLLLGAQRGELGHAIGFGCGLICGVAHAARHRRTRTSPITA